MKQSEEDIIEENLASRLVADFGLFDPTLDLSNNYTLDLLNILLVETNPTKKKRKIKTEL
jgi:hypothetical protein